MKTLTTPKNSTLVFLGAIAIAAVFAVTRRDGGVATAAAPAPDSTMQDAQQPGALPADKMNGPLPAGHPPIGDMPGGHPAMGASPGGVPTPEAPAIDWVAPKGFEQAPNPSTFRIATYEVPKVAGDHENPELSISRAGGATDANVQRWLGQFDENGRKNAKRTERTVNGLKVVIIDVEGDYAGMKGEQEKDWAMLGAVIETPGQSHFFKLTGPKNSVHAARADFDKLIDSVKPR